ncbi:MAG: tellurite resistance TerB family protein [Alphaproteobacteria bacterium]
MSDPSALLNQFLGQITGTPETAAADSGSAPGGGLNLKSLMSGPGALATGAVAGGLAGLLLGGKKKPRKLAKGALKVGGVALVGGLAYKAWRNWQANQQPAAPAPTAQPAPVLPAPVDTPFVPDTPAEEADLSKALIRAMIAAAKADGHVTAEERQRITGQLTDLDLDAEDRAFIDSELAKSLDVDAVARAAKTPEQAAEIYAASLLAIDPNGDAERGYLAMLAARLKLDPALVAHLHAEADALTEGQTD